MEFGDYREVNRMKVIAVLNQKGGSGKTTISTHLARALQLMYEDETTILIDSDPQGSARDFAAASEDQPVMVVGLDRAASLGRDVRKLRADYVVIDGAPQAAELAAAALVAADLVLIPVQPSPYDIWATADLVALVKQRQEITDGKLKAAFVISRLITGTVIGNEIREALAGYELPVLDTAVHQRVEYPKTAARGTTVLDSSADPAARAEIKELAAEAIAFLEGVTEGVPA